MNNVDFDLSFNLNLSSNLDHINGIVIMDGNRQSAFYSGMFPNNDLVTLFHLEDSESTVIIKKDPYNPQKESVMVNYFPSWKLRKILLKQKWILYLL